MHSFVFAVLLLLISINALTPVPSPRPTLDGSGLSPSPTTNGASPSNKPTPSPTLTGSGSGTSTVPTQTGSGLSPSPTSTNGDSPSTKPTPGPTPAPVSPGTVPTPPPTLDGSGLSPVPTMHGSNGNSPSTKPTPGPTPSPVSPGTVPTPSPTSSLINGALSRCIATDTLLDIIFIVDSSGSIYDDGYKNWEAELELVYDIIDNALPLNSRVGLINFSGCGSSYSFIDCKNLNRLKQMISLTDNGSPNDLDAVLSTVDAIGEEDFNGGYTWTNEALGMALEEFNSNSADGSDKMIMLITDGEPYPSDGGHAPCKTSTGYVSSTLQSLRELDVSIVTVAIDVVDDIKEEYFDCISGSDFYFDGTFDSISSSPTPSPVSGSVPTKTGGMSMAPTLVGLSPVPTQTGTGLSTSPTLGASPSNKPTPSPTLGAGLSTVPTQSQGTSTVPTQTGGGTSTAPTQTGPGTSTVPTQTGRTSTVSPGTSTVSPGTSTISPGSSTVTPGTSTVSPGSSTVSPGSSTISPGTSTVSPGSSTVSPGTSTVPTQTGSGTSTTRTQTGSVLSSVPTQSQGLSDGDSPTSKPTPRPTQTGSRTSTVPTQTGSGVSTSPTSTNGASPSNKPTPSPTQTGSGLSPSPTSTNGDSPSTKPTPGPTPSPVSPGTVPTPPPTLDGSGLSPEPTMYVSPATIPTAHPVMAVEYLSDSIGDFICSELGSSRFIVPTKAPTSIGIPSAKPTNTPTMAPVGDLEGECESNTELDIIFIVDSSGSVYDDGYINWHLEINLVYDIIDTLPGTTSRASLINFSGCGSQYTLTQCKAQGRLNTIFDLDTYGTDLDLVSSRVAAIDSYDFNGGYTWTNEALGLALDQFNSNSDSDKTKVIVLLTDGEAYPYEQDHEPCVTSTSYSSATLTALNELDVNIITVGIDISEEIKEEKLDCVSEFYFGVSQFNTLNSLSVQIGELICDELDGDFICSELGSSRFIVPTKAPTMNTGVGVPSPGPTPSPTTINVEVTQGPTTTDEATQGPTSNAIMASIYINFAIVISGFIGFVLF